MKTPFLIVGDGPAEPTGLSRIARDLTQRIIQTFDGLEVVQLGGPCPPVWPGWRTYPLDRSDDWGASEVQTYWDQLFGRRPGILFCIWDPSRLIAYAPLDLPCQKWAYTAIDAANVNDGISGPAAEALSRFDRVLAYGRWASRILRSCRERVPYLPHGINTKVFSDPIGQDEQEWADEILGPYVGDRWVLGCVATNQFRKDLGLYFQTLKALQDAGHPVYGWLHCDEYVKAWSLPQLVEDFRLQRQITITMAADRFSDRQMAALYQRCAVTFLPSTGEGYGYPLVESLAAGVPCIHHTYAGGTELVPKSAWRIPARAWRLESCYAMKRPVFDAEDAKNAILRAVDWRLAVGEQVCRAYCYRKRGPPRLERTLAQVGLLGFTRTERTLTMGRDERLNPFAQRAALVDASDPVVRDGRGRVPPGWGRDHRAGGAGPVPSANDRALPGSQRAGRLHGRPARRHDETARDARHAHAGTAARNVGRGDEVEPGRPDGWEEGIGELRC